MKGFKEQNTFIDSMSQQRSCSSMSQWQKVCEGLPQNIVIFVPKALILQLAYNTNGLIQENNLGVGNNAKEK